MTAPHKRKTKGTTNGKKRRVKLARHPRRASGAPRAAPGEPQTPRIDHQRPRIDHQRSRKRFQRFLLEEGLEVFGEGPKIWETIEDPLKGLGRHAKAIGFQGFLYVYEGSKVSFTNWMIPRVPRPWFRGKH